MFIYKWVVVGMLMAVSVISMRVAGATTVEAQYKVNVEGFDKMVLFWLFANQYTMVGVTIETSSKERISIFNKKRQRVGFLAPPDFGEQFLPDPFEPKNARAAYGAEALAKMYSLFAFALEPVHQDGDEKFVDFAYTDQKTKKTTYHGILLMLKSRALSPFPAIDMRVYGSRLIAAWEFEVRWVQSERRRLTKENYQDEGRVYLEGRGFVVPSGELRGTILGLRAQYLGSPVLKPTMHFILKKLCIDRNGVCEDLKAP